MPYYLYAGALDREGYVVDVALVGEYADATEAEQSRQVQEVCYSDEGLVFSVQPKPISPPPNVKYDDLCERVMK